jgi:uncharacterized protein YndB with AHSA1/START domain
MPPTGNSEGIVKQVVLQAPLERAWRAIADADAFGHWFGARFDGAFEAGARLHARIEPTTVDPEVARQQQPHAGMTFDVVVDRVEPMHRLSFRWHPGAGAGADPSDAEMTLVEFALDEVAQGVRLTITESGFERVPAARRAQAIADNSGGWEAQTGLIAKYLAQQGA